MVGTVARVGLEYVDEPYRSVLKLLLDALICTWRDRLVSLVLFGSIARGDHRSGSDIDLLVVGKEKHSWTIEEHMFTAYRDLWECMYSTTIF